MTEIYSGCLTCVRVPTAPALPMVVIQRQALHVGFNWQEKSRQAPFGNTAPGSCRKAPTLNFGEC